MADDLDWIAYTDAREALGFSPGDTTLADLFAIYITGVSRRLDEYAGPAVIREVSGELHDGGRRSITLDQSPVTEITALTEYDGATSTTITGHTLGDAHPSDGFTVDLSSGIVHRFASGAGSRFCPGHQNIEATYTAGRVADTAGVDPLFVEQAIVTLDVWWNRNRPGLVTEGEFETPGARFPRFAIPNHTVEALRHHRRELGQSALGAG